MKKFFKIILWTIIIVGLPLAGYWAYLHYFYKENQIKVLSAVPSDAVFILETSDLFEAYNRLSKSQIWMHLTDTKYFADISDDLKLLDKYIKSTSLPESFFENRTLLISAHLVNNSKIGYLFLIDLKGFSKVFKSLKNSLKYVDGYNMSIQKYVAENNRKYEIIKLVEKANKKNKIYIAFANNVLLVSYDAVLIQNSLDESKDKFWEKNGKIQQLTSQYPLQKLFRFYINFSKVDDFIYSFQTKHDPFIDMLSQSLSYGVLDLDYGDKTIELTGSVAPDTTYDFGNILKAMKPASVDAYKIMSDQTAAFVSLTFDNYDKFYKALMESYAQRDSAEYEELQKGMKVLNTVFGIDVEDDIFSWIGREITLFKLTPIGINKTAEDVVIAIDTRNPILAKAKLDTLERKIKAVTPFKFKTITYRGYDISYLHIRNFFDLFFGKMFSQIQKPYYTIIRNYVVFSNSVEVLERVIDDYLDGYTLSDKDAFMEFTGMFWPRANFTTFIRMPYMYSTIYTFAPADDKKFMKENEDLFTSIARLGFQLTYKDNLFKIKMAGEYDPSAKIASVMEQMEKESVSSSLLKRLDSMDFVIKIPDSLSQSSGELTYTYKTDKGMAKAEGEIHQGKPIGFWRTYYPDGNLESVQMYDADGVLQGTVQFFYDISTNNKMAEFEVKDGKPDGDYMEFYPCGDVKIKMTFKEGKPDGEVFFYYRDNKVKVAGKYKDGLKHGKWVYYDKEGNIISQEKWKNGVKKG